MPHIQCCELKSVDFINAKIINHGFLLNTFCSWSSHCPSTKLSNYTPWKYMAHKVSFRFEEKLITEAIPYTFNLSMAPWLMMKTLTSSVMQMILQLCQTLCAGYLRLQNLKIGRFLGETNIDIVNQPICTVCVVNSIILVSIFIGIGTGDQINIWRGGQEYSFAPRYLAPSRENSPQIPWFKPMFCSKSDSFQRIRPLDPYRYYKIMNLFMCWHRPVVDQCRAPLPILAIFLCYDIWRTTVTI